MPIDVEHRRSSSNTVDWCNFRHVLPPHVVFVSPVIDRSVADTMSTVDTTRTSPWFTSFVSMLQASSAALHFVITSTLWPPGCRKLIMSKWTQQSPTLCVRTIFQHWNGRETNFASCIWAASSRRASTRLKQLNGRERSSTFVDAKVRCYQTETEMTYKESSKLETSSLVQPAALLNATIQLFEGVTNSSTAEWPNKVDLTWDVNNKII